MVAERHTVSQVAHHLRSLRDGELESFIARYAGDERPGIRALLRSAHARIAERDRLNTLAAIEDGLRSDGAEVLVGIDEVGRGAVAGPLTVAACVLPADARISRLDDSKRLSPRVRVGVAEAVRELAIAYHVVHVPASDVDAAGVSRALKEAMCTAVEALRVVPDRVLVDGIPLGLFRNEVAIVKGDTRVSAIAAASVLAKVERDALMLGHAPEYPAYGFDRNKGYGTAEHLEAIRAHGPCVLHRRSFLSSILDPRLF